MPAIGADPGSLDPSLIHGFLARESRRMAGMARRPGALPQPDPGDACWHLPGVRPQRCKQALHVSGGAATAARRAR